MDWNCNLRPPFVSLPDNSLSFFYNYNYDPYQEMKHSMQKTQIMVPQMLNKNNYGNQEKKKRLTSEQLESLESSFQEEIKLDPDRKMKLAKDLGMQPRQIAVWFQNRRARWKAKQLERLYEGVKQELEVVSMEKQKLQEEVMALRSIIKEQGGKKPVSTGHTKMSGGEETVESTSMSRSDNLGAPKNNNQQMPECSYVFNVDDYNPAMPPAYWGGLPTYQ